MLEISCRFSRKCKTWWLRAELVQQQAFGVVADWPATWSYMGQTSCITEMGNTDKKFSAHHRHNKLHYSIYCWVLLSVAIRQYKKIHTGVFPVRIF
jgi:hypothetical protein